MLKETTGAFGGIRTPANQAFTEYESDARTIAPRRRFYKQYGVDLVVSLSHDSHTFYVFIFLGDVSVHQLSHFFNLLNSRYM